MIPALLRSRALTGGFLALALVALGIAVWRSAPELGLALQRLATAPGWTAAAFAAYVAFVLMLGMLWRALLARLGGATLPVGGALRVQALAWYARYLPGKVGLVAGKLLLVPGSRVGAAWAAGYEQVLFLAAGVAVVTATAATSRFTALLPGAGLASVAVLLALLLWLAAQAAPRLDGLVARLAGGGEPRAHPRVAELGGWLAAFACAHALVGAGFYALLRALGHGDELGIVAAIGMLTAAHLGGIIAVIAPAGLGVRELLLAGFLTPALGAQEALAVALITRAWATLGDLLLAPLLLAAAPRAAPD